MPKHQHEWSKPFRNYLNEVARECPKCEAVEILLAYHKQARYIDCKLSDADYCDKCGWTNKVSEVNKNFFSMLPDDQSGRHAQEEIGLLID